MNEEIEYKKIMAQKAFEDNNIPQAVKTYDELIDEIGLKDQNLLAKYGQALRKNGEPLKFIEVCREYIKKQKITFNRLNSSLCWCIYDEYIKKYDEDNIDGFDEFLKEAKYICDNTKQLKAAEYYKNPYVITVIKVIQVYNNRNNTNYSKVLEWLELLNPNILSEEVYTFTDSKGIQRERASHKEFYYQNKIKSLEKTFQYSECYQLCEECFKEIKKFHYKNDIWIESRKLFCKCMEDQSYIDEYMEFAQKNNLWHIYKKVSDICFRFNKIEEALIYGSKSILCSFEYEKMVNLFLSMGQLFENIGETINAKIMFQASAYYRKRNGWKIPEELEYEVEKYILNIDNKPSRKQIENISMECLKKNDIFKRGKVVKILEGNKSGFIKIESESRDIYFNIRDSKEKNIRKYMYVDFEIIEIDNKFRAINIRKSERRNCNGSICKPKRY